MALSDKQVRQLRRPLAQRHIRTRRDNGKDLHYLEGWHVIAEANRIFGFDGWDRETTETRCVFARESRGGEFVAFYVARVRVNVRADGASVARDGHGTGEGRARTAAEAHDLALKTAETDATKRALATFGRPFGLSLYLGGARSDRPPPSRQAEEAGNNGSRLNGHNGLAEASPSPVQDEPRAPPPEANTSPEAQRVDKSQLAIPEPLRRRDRDHLHFVASQPCLACGRRPADAHHIGFAQPRALGRKVSDEFTVPLCREHHDELHRSGNERAWWHEMGIDPIGVSASLWRDSRGADGLPSPSGSDSVPAHFNQRPPRLG